jgi:hypothetical protein
MNRREMLKRVAGVAAAAGIPATAKAIDAEPAPLALVCMLDRGITQEQAERLRNEWSKLFTGPERMPPVIICPPGMTVKAIPGVEIGHMVERCR